MKSLDAYNKPPELNKDRASKKPERATAPKTPDSTSKETKERIASDGQDPVAKGGGAEGGNSSGVPYFWQVLMVLASGLYLIPEAIFNAELVNVSGQGVIGEDNLRHIELFGRMISGIGVSLLVCDAIGSRFVKSGTSAMGVTALVFLLCWPTVFFGQKVLVDKFIIEPSTPEDRQHAYLSQLVRGALANNTIKIEGIDYNPDHKFNPQEMTFMALFGGMVYADDRLAQVFEDRGSQVIEAMVKKDAYGDFEQHWTDYSQLYETLKTQYTSYADASRQYNSALAEIPKKQEQNWSDVQSQIERGWNEYRQAVDDHRARARANAEQYAPKIFDYFDRRNKCRSESCVSRLDKRYYQEIGNLGLGRIDPPYWHKEVPVSVTENVAGTIGSAIGSLGLSLIAQGADLATGGDGGFKDKKLVYTNDPEHYEEKINALPEFEQKFVNQTGYPTHIGNFTDFKRHPFTATKVSQSLAKKGLPMPDGWNATDKATFNERVRRKFTDTANAEWNSKTKERGLDIPPNIPWKKFQVLPEIQKKIEGEMGDFYVSPTPADWNRQTFKDRIIDPAIKREAAGILARLKSQQGSYADGQENEAIGKQMLRAIVIPPISMGLSLFLVILTIIKLPSKTFGLFKQKSAAKASLPVRLGLRLTTVALVVAVPLFLWSPTYTEDGSTVHYFLAKTADSGGATTKHFLSWVLHAQPVMHPVGDTLESIFNLYQSSEATVKTLERLDKRVIGGV